MGNMISDSDARRWILCDWGGTVMEDRPGSTGPMFQWSTLIAVEGCGETLQALSAHYRFVLATNAADSDEDEIREALRKVKLNSFFEHVFCARTLGYRKPSREFFHAITQTLSRKPAELTMLGDDFEVDVLGSTLCGFHGIWLNLNSTERRFGERHSTILNWRELPAALLAQEI